MAHQVSAFKSVKLKDILMSIKIKRILSPALFSSVLVSSLTQQEMERDFPMQFFDNFFPYRSVNKVWIWIVYWNLQSLIMFKFLLNKLFFIIIINSFFKSLIKTFDFENVYTFKVEYSFLLNFLILTFVFEGSRLFNLTLQTIAHSL